MKDVEIKNLLLDLLDQRPGMRRKELIELCIDKLGYTGEQKRDQRVNSEVVRAKNRVGALLTGLIDGGDIEENEAGRMTVLTGVRTLFAREQAERFVLDCLKNGKEMNRNELFHEADLHFEGAEIHSVVGQAIANLLREKRLRESEHGYVLPPDSIYPNTEIGNILQEARSGGDLKKCFREAVHLHGGEWLEYYAVQLLGEYYRQCGKTVTAAYVTGGSDDGGLDGVIETTDWLGFREQTLMQMKNRYAQITPKDVREFYGAVCAERGSRGVFVTLSSFHPEAQRLMDKVDNLIGVDGDRLFEIAKLCRCGILDYEGGYCLDDDLFLEGF